MMQHDTDVPDIAPNNVSSLLEGALYYAAQGFRVFPLQDRSRIPRKGTSWPKMATNDPYLIETYWAQWPQANIGLVTGAANNILVVDVDMKNGANGIRSYQAIAQETYSGPTQSTPTGGKHLLFKYKGGLINFTRKGSWGGLDMRTDRGYIVVSPSVVPEGRYQWSDVGPVPEMGDRLWSICTEWSKDAPVSDVDAPDTVCDLPNIDDLGLRRHHLDYLQHGDCSYWLNPDDGRPDESAAVFACGGALMRATGAAATVYSIMLNNQYAWACAERHTAHSPQRWLWKYGIAKAVASSAPIDAADHFTPVGNVDIIQPSDTLQPTPQSASQQFDGSPEVSAPAQPVSSDTREVEPETLVNEYSGPFMGLCTGLATQLAPANWLIDGLIEEGQVGILYGESGTGKTFMALDIALHVSCGRGWHRQKIKDSGPVLYVTAEGGKGFWRRAAAWILGFNHQHKRNPVVPEDLASFSLSSTPVDMMSATGMKDISDLVSTMTRAPKLIVIDTLAANMTGDENSSGDVSRMLKVCLKMSDAWGCAVIIVHHPNKAGVIRGSGAIYNGSDFVLSMSRIEASKVPSIQLTLEKSKDAELPPPFYFELQKQFLINVVDDLGRPSSSLSMQRISKQASSVKVTTQVRLSESRAEVLGCAVDVIQTAQLLSPGTTCYASSDEIWVAYAAYCSDNYGPEYLPKRQKMNSVLSALVNKGFLDFDEKAGGTWYKLVKGSD